MLQGGSPKYPNLPNPPIALPNLQRYGWGYLKNRMEIGWRVLQTTWEKLRMVPGRLEFRPLEQGGPSGGVFPLALTGDKRKKNTTNPTRRAKSNALVRFSTMIL